MSQALFIVNAFSRDVFGGNPAAVMLLDEWLPDATLQALAGQHQLSETAFLRREAGRWALRWFTPACEVDLCGHATLASAHVLVTECGVQGAMHFETRSGSLEVMPLNGGRYRLDLPAVSLEAASPDPAVVAALGCGEVLEAAKPTNNPWQWVYRVADQRAVEAATPDFSALSRAANYGIALTAQGQTHDVVSRFFIPSAGVDEDPVTGSAHCLLTPFWSERLGLRRLSARQCSQRGGELDCELVGERVWLSGDAVTYARADILPSL